MKPRKELEPILRDQKLGTASEELVLLPADQGTSALVAVQWTDAAGELHFELLSAERSADYLAEA